MLPACIQPAYSLCKALLGKAGFQAGSSSVGALGNGLMSVPVNADLSDNQQFLPLWPMAHHALVAIQISAGIVVTCTVVPDLVCSGLSVSV